MDPIRPPFQPRRAGIAVAAALPLLWALSAIARGSTPSVNAAAAPLARPVEVWLVAATTIYTLLTAWLVWSTSRQTAAQSRNVAMDSFRQTLALMERTRRHRARIRDYLASVERGEANLAPPEASIDAVCRAYDILGMLDRNGMIDRRIIDQFYAPPLILLYEQILGAWVAEVRRPIEQGGRGPTHYWDLVKLHDRVRLVNDVHPAILQTEDWQRDPRRGMAAHRPNAK